jgi:glucosylglycerate phosphorylase
MLQNIYTILLTQIYGAEAADEAIPYLESLIERYRGQIPTPSGNSLSEHDSILITYGDQVRQAGKPPLQSLADFCEDHLRGLISGIHILPFYPWSSDDGFAVKDYRRVDPALGEWQDVERIGRRFDLMFDGVINHVSAQGEWFQAFLRAEKPYCNYFICIDENPDLSGVVRPRTLPLLTEFETAAGKRRVWTTFSADQVDLDYHNPEVLLEILDILLVYAKHGARFIRLDAIAYLWKEVGSSCIHLPQTHAIIKLLRAILDEVAPHVYIITETNVPHLENVSYFGDGTDEAQLVYNFALPPLVLHTFRTGDASILSEWASGLESPSDKTTFINFLASHDGIGLNPIRGILSTAEIDALVKQTLAHGGLISYKQNSDGSKSPYELNINFFDALSDPNSEEPLDLQVARFLASQAVMLSLRGLPGIYFHSLFGSRSWLEGVRATHQNRTINRQKLEFSSLDDELSDPISLRYKVFNGYRHLLLQRSACTAFHPHGGQEVLDAGSKIFAVLRSSPDNSQFALCIQNIASQTEIATLLNTTVKLEPYQTLWLAKNKYT